MAYVAMRTHHRVRSSKASSPQIIAALERFAGRGGDVPRAGKNVEEVDPGRELGRERSEWETAHPRHAGAFPRRPRRVCGGTQGHAVVGTDQIAGRGARAIGDAGREGGELG
jgi:hypothetical protein